MEVKNGRELIDTANKLVAPAKGILAADESTPTIKKRFDTINVESTADTRNGYREMLFRTEGVEENISGVILFEETLKATAQDGTPFPKLLADKGIVPGIKCDKGLTVIPDTKGEKATQGLDGLYDRLVAYYELGARFSKWRAVIDIGHGIPSLRAIEINAHLLARYARISQCAGLVPIVEPEVLMDGDHTIETCERVTFDTLNHVFFELYKQKVMLEGMLLKPNMVVSGLGCADQAGPDKVAEMTIQCFKQILPPALPGVVFLSGGQSSVQATENLNAMNAMDKSLPWELSYSYGRALQEKSLGAWKGEAANIPEAQKQMRHRARCNGLARSGEYTSAIENDI